MEGKGSRKRSHGFGRSEDFAQEDTRTASTNHSFPELSHAPRRSARAQEQRERKMDALTKKASVDFPEFKSDNTGDVTVHMLAPMELRADGRFYVKTSVRRRINEQIESTHQVHSSLESANLPPKALQLRQQAQEGNVSTFHMSTRSDRDGFRSGTDLTYTENIGLDTRGTRSGRDTPRPRSPPPGGTDFALTPEMRYENGHQDPFRLTQLPGHTINEPQPGNQVVSTHMERFVVEGGVGSFLYREDTFWGSHLYAVRFKGSSVETRHASFQRRRDPARALDTELTAMPKPKRNRSGSI